MPLSNPGPCCPPNSVTGKFFHHGGCPVRDSSVPQVGKSICSYTKTKTKQEMASASFSPHKKSFFATEEATRRWGSRTLTRTGECGCKISSGNPPRPSPSRRAAPRLRWAGGPPPCSALRRARSDPQLSGTGTATPPPSERPDPANLGAARSADTGRSRSRRPRRGPRPGGSACPPVP